MKKALICLILAVFAVIGGVSCSSETDSSSDEDTADINDFEKSETATDYVRIDTDKYGSILIELYPDIAPITVENFKKLVSEKFYNNVTFHRAVEGFMIQGGDPTASGSGGPGWKIIGEFSSNGVQNDLLHTRGVISMARSNGLPNSAGSQFFIMQEAAPHLDGNYAAFGKVIYGIKAVDEIAALKTQDEIIIDKPVMTSVYFVTKTEKEG